MRKLLTILILFETLFASAQTPTEPTAPTSNNTAPVYKFTNGYPWAPFGVISAWLTTTDQLAGFTGYSGMSVVVNQYGRGGKFDYHSTSENLVPDSGIVFLCANGFLVRDTSNMRSYNIQWFGAVGDGVTSYKKDSVAIRAVVNLLWRNNGGSVYFPKTGNFYGWNGDGIPIPSNTELFGDGAATEIRHVNPSSATYYRGVIFYTTTYATDSVHNPYMKAPRYGIYDANKGQTYVRLRNIADTIHFPVNKVVLLGAKIFFKGNRSKGKIRCLQNDINKVYKISGDSLFFKYSLSDSLYEDTAVAKIYDVNSGTTSSPQLGTDYLSENIHIHDMTLSQADYDMITGLPYDEKNIYPNIVIGLGGTFDSKYQRLTMKNFASFGGNLMGHCDFSNLIIVGARKLCDFGFSTSSTSFHDITWLYYRNLFLDSVEVAYVYIDDGNHEFKMYNINASGDWTGNNIFKIANGATYIYIDNVVFNLPHYVEYRESALDIDDDDSVNYCHDVYINNVSITVDTVGKYLEITGSNSATDNKNIRLTNLKFFGNTAPDSTTNAISIKNAGNIYMDNIFFEKGDTVLIKNNNGGIFKRITALNAVLNADEYSQIWGDFEEGGMNGISIGKKTNFRNSSLLLYGIDAAPDFAGTLTTAIGNLSMKNQIAGSRNTALGYLSLRGFTTSQTVDSSTAIGAVSLNSVETNTSANTALGTGAGGAVRSGSRNTLIGAGADVKTTSTANAIALGYYAIAEDNEFAVPDATTNFKINGISWKFPSLDGSAGQVLTTNANKVLSWATVGSVGSVSGTADRITVVGSSSAVIDIASTYVGQTSLTTLGTIATGTWNGTAIANAYIASGLDASKLTTGTLPNARIVALPNANLQNSAITINGTSVSLGGTIDTRAISTTLGSDQTTTNSTITDVTGLSVAVEASTKYRVTVVLFTGCSTANGDKFAINAPAGSTLHAGIWNGSTTSAAASGLQRCDAINTLSGIAFNRYNGATGVVALTVYITTSVTSGNFQIRFGANTGGDTATVFTGSTIDAVKIQ